VFTWKMLPMNS